jgi:FkbM family methyltransferase
MRSLLEKALRRYARDFPIHKGKFRLVEALWPLACVPGDRLRMASTRRGGFEVPCDLDAFIQRQIYFFGDYYLERDLLSVWADSAAKAAIVLDVGANIGIYSLTAAASNPAARIHAFEPTSEIAATLREIVRRNGLDNIAVHECAVMDVDGTANLVRCRGTYGANDGMNFVVADPRADASPIQAMRLDRFCATEGIEAIDLMKIDVQGHELTVLAGAGALVGNRIGVIFLELNWSGSQSGGPAGGCVDLLSGAGYLFSTPAAWPSFREAGDWLRAESDVIACSGPWRDRARWV